jgi:perosamine synthetase
MVPLAVPFWNRETYRNIRRCFLSREIVRGIDLVALQPEIVRRLAVGDALLCGSASLSLELALRSGRLGPGDEVVIPALCCSALVPPILAVGATPVLADVGAELNLTAETVDAVITGRTRAIIVPHLFGNPADIVAIAALADARGIIVIDDAAQALGATVEGQPVGSFGDMGVISFGTDKICFGLGGGALVAQSSGVVESVREVPLGEPSTVSLLRRLTTVQVRRRWRHWSRVAEPWTFGRRDPSAPPVAYAHERMANLQAAVAASLLHVLDENLAARRARVQQYRELLGDCAGVELIAHRSGSACLTQVMRILPRRGEDTASQVISALHSAGFEVQGSYMPIHLLEGFSACVWDRLPHTDEVWAELVELPCEPSVAPEHTEAIAAIVRRSVA